MAPTFCCEQLESRDCPTVLFPSPPPPVTPPTTEYLVTGVSEGDQDLIVINPADTGFVEILHHRGFFFLNNGIVMPAIPRVTEVSRTRLFGLTSLVIVVEAGQGQDFVVNNTGLRSRIYGGSGQDYLVGGSANDTLSGGSEDDEIAGRGGNDWVQGDGGYDDLWGGAGADTLDGGANGDRLFGESGADTLYGRGGQDRLEGGIDADVDRLVGGAHADTFVRHWSVLAGNVHTTVDVLVDFSETENDLDERP